MGVWTSTPHDATAGAVLTAAQWDGTVKDGFTAFGAMSAYTPTWSSTGTAPVLNNGTIVGGYTQIQKTVIFRAVVTFGSTTTYGTGSYSPTLPVAPSSGVRWSFTGWAVDGSNITPIFGMVNGSTSITLVTAAPANVGPTTPYTFGSGDSIHISGVYEAA